MIKTIEELRADATAKLRETLPLVTSVEGFYADYLGEACLPASESARQHLYDNLALDLIATDRDEDPLHSGEFAEKIREIYTLAEIVFKTHKGLAIAFDRESEYSFWGSPWLHYCATPTEYVVCWARRSLETDDGEINGLIAPKQTESAISLFGLLVESCEKVTEDIRGPSYEDLRPLVKLFCYSRLPLIVAIEQEFRLVPSLFTHEDIIKEAEFSSLSNEDILSGAKLSAA